MAKKIIKVGAELDRSQIDKQLKDLENTKAKINIDINDSGTINNTANSVKKLNNTARETESIFGKIKNAISNTFSSGKLAMTAYLTVLNEINKAGKEAKQTIKEIDKAITDLQIATDMSRESVESLVKSYNDYGKKLSASTTDVTSAADDYLRAGKTLNESQQLIRDSIMLSKLGKLTSSESTENLLAVMNGYSMSVDGVSRALDTMVALDMEAATSAGDIATALKYSASSADMAGLSFNKLASMISAVQDKTQQSAEVVGTFMNTLLSRYRNVKIGQFISDDGEDLSEVETILESLDIKLRNSNQEFRNFELVIDEVASRWLEFSSVQQAAIAKAFSGTRQQNRFYALMSGYEKVLELTEVAANSAGTAIDKYTNSYLNSLEAQQTRLQTSFESMIINTNLDEVYSDIISATTALVEFIDKTHALEGAMSGMAVGVGLKGFIALKSGIYEAYIKLNQFQNALNIVKSTEFVNDKFDDLLIFTKNLSVSQTRLVLSSKNLTATQKEQIITNSALTEQEKVRLMQTLKLTTAQNGLTVATTSLGNSLKGMLASMVANPIFLITTAISAATMAYQKYNQEVEETRQKNLETGESAREYANNLEELYTEYTRLASIQERTSSEEEDFKSIIEDVTKALGDKADALKDLKTGTDEYTESLKEATKAELEEQYAKAKIGADAAKEALKDTTYDFWSMTGSKITILQDNEIIDTAENKMALDEVKDILKLYEDTSQKSIEWEPVNWDNDKNNMEAVVEYYNALIEARTKLVTVDNADTLMDTEIYKDINSVIGKMSSSVEEYTKQQYNALKLQYEWQNGIPSTTEEFEAMENAILNASGAGEYFQQTIKDYLAEDFSGLYSKIADELPDVKDDDTSAIPILSLDNNQRKALDEYQSRLSLITKLRDEWNNSSTSDKMSFMSDIAEQFEDYDLSALKNGEKTIEEVIDDLGSYAVEQAKKNIGNFDDELANMLPKSATQLRAIEYEKASKEVEEIESILNRIKSGEDFDQEEMSQIINKFGDLSDAVLVVGDSYSLEEDALIDLLNESKKVVNELIALDYERTREFIDNSEVRRQAILDEYNAYKTLYGGLLEGIDEEGSAVDKLYKKYLDGNLDTRDLINMGYMTSDAELLLQAFSKLETEEIALNISTERFEEFEEKYKKFTQDVAKSKDKKETTQDTKTSDSFSQELNLVDRLLEQSSRKLEDYKTALENAFDVDSKNIAIDNIVTEIQRQYEELGTISEFYAGKVSDTLAQIPEEYRDVIQNGSIDIRTITDEGIYDLIKQYQEYDNQLRECTESMQALIKEAQDFASQKIDLQIDELEKDIEGIEDVIEGINASIDGVEDEINDIEDIIEGINDEIDVLNEQIEGIEDRYDDLISPLQDELDLLKEQNDERQMAIDLQKKEAELERLKGQKTNKVYREGEGFVYESDQDAIRNAQEDYDNALFEKKIHSLEKQISILEKSKDDEIQAIEDVIEAHEDRIKIYEKEIEAHRNRIKLYEEEIEAHEKVIESLREKIKTQEELKEGVKETITLALKGSDDIKQKLNEVILKEKETKQATIDNTTQIVESSKVAQGAISETFLKVDGDINRLGNNMTAMINNVEGQLRSMVNSVSSSISSLSSQINGLSSQANTLSKKISSLKAEKSSLESSLKNSPLNNAPTPTSTQKTSNDPMAILKSQFGTNLSFHDGLESGFVGEKGSTQDKKDLLKTLALEKLDRDEVISKLQVGEAVLTKDQQFNLVDNFRLISNPIIPNVSMPKYDFSALNRTPQISIGDVNVTCSGVTSQQVAKQIGDELHKNFGNITLDALQMSYKK